MCLVTLASKRVRRTAQARGEPASLRMKASTVLALFASLQLLSVALSLDFDTFTGMRCDTCGIMCGRLCGNRVFKACCYSHNKRSADAGMLRDEELGRCSD